MRLAGKLSKLETRYITCDMVKEKHKITPDTLIKDSGLSIRSINVLFQNAKDFGIEFIPGVTRKTATLGDFEGLSIQKIRGYRGVGKKTQLEIAEIFEQAGVKIEEGSNLEANKGNIVVHFNRNSRQGKILFDLANLLAEQDREIVVTETD